MTRINLIEPKELTNKHLMAEYRELPRIFTAVKVLIEKGVNVDDVEISNQYVLGKGHVKFFYNKIDWLLIRYEKITKELLSRKFNINEELVSSVVNGVNNISLEWKKSNYSPSPQEIYLNMARLIIRSDVGEAKEEVLKCCKNDIDL